MVEPTPPATAPDSSALPQTSSPSQASSPAAIPPGKVEPPIEVLVGRWLFLGCAATLAVLILAFVAFGGLVAWGVAKQ